jgi:hypothetical protein
LRRLTGVETVLELANSFTSTATVFLADDRLPDLELWHREFTNVANASYKLRGVEITLAGPIKQTEGQLWLQGDPERPAVRLAPLNPGNKVYWDFATQAPLPLDPEEAAAYTDLQRAVTGQAAPASATVTGTLLKDEHGFYLEVRAYTP